MRGDVEYHYCAKHRRYYVTACPPCAEPVLRTPEVEPQATLEEVAAELGISAERVRQLEQKALEKVRRGFRRLGIRSAEDALPDPPRIRYRAVGGRFR